VVSHTAACGDPKSIHPKFTPPNKLQNLIRVFTYKSPPYRPSRILIIARMAQASSGAPLTEDDIEKIEAYTLGDTFNPDEKEFLLPFILMLNGAIIAHLQACGRFWLSTGVAVRPSCSGNGLFSGAGAKKGDSCAVYFGTLEVDERYKGRRDYAIQLPSMRIMELGKTVRIILCGYTQRHAPLNAVMLNHACHDDDINVRFETVAVQLYDIEARQKFRAAMRMNPYDVPASVRTAGEKVIFEYYIVVAHVIMDVPAGKEFRVSYDRVRKNGRLDYRTSYFMTLKAAADKMKPDEVVVPCICKPAEGSTPAHCPWHRVFVINRAFLPLPP